MAADDVGGVRKPVRVRVARRAQQQRGGVDRAAGDDDDVGAVGLLGAPAVDDDPRDRASGRVGLQPRDPSRGVRSVTFGCSSAGRTQQHVRVGLAVGQAGEAVEAVAAHAAPGLGVGLVEVDRRPGRWNGWWPVAHEVVVQLLDPRLVGDGGVGERARARRLGRVLAGLRRGRGRAARPGRSRARGRRRRSARPGRRRRSGGPRSKSRSRRRKRIAAVELGVAADEVVRRAGGTRRRACRTSARVVT